MTATKIVSERPIDLTELRDELEIIQKRDKELSFRSSKTLEYINNFSAKQSRKTIIKKLEELNLPRVRDIHLMKIADFMPATVEELKAVLQGYPITVSADNMKKIVEVIQANPSK
ncbi:hypothetical protein HYU14_07295 [Candidatus Woesearchaeota archaeon]|nr:hypothetical protein [Candidatus Woesearchaeota archaeon]